LQQLQLLFQNIHRVVTNYVNQPYKPLFIPSSVHINLTQKRFDLTFEIQKQDTVAYVQNGTHVHFYGPVHIRAHLAKAMRQFFIEHAKVHMTPLVDRHAQHMKLFYKNLRYKNQKSLWGSCSDLGNVNLNIRMMFLPQELCEYVIIHELCHLRHLNHSKSFWKLVSQYCKDYHKFEKELLLADKYIPKWIFRL